MIQYVVPVCIRPENHIPESWFCFLCVSRTRIKQKLHLEFLSRTRSWSSRTIFWVQVWPELSSNRLRWLCQSDQNRILQEDPKSQQKLDAESERRQTGFNWIRPVYHMYPELYFTEPRVTDLHVCSRGVVKICGECFWKRMKGLWFFGSR